MDLPSEPVWFEHWRAWEIGPVGEYNVLIIPMLFNHRLILAERGLSYSYDIGWCYPNLVSALAAVAVWDPTSGALPPGFIKEVPCQNGWAWVLERLRATVDDREVSAAS